MQNNNDIGIRITAEVDKRSVRTLRSTAKESEMARKRMIGQTGKDARAIGKLTRSQNNLSRAASDTSRSIGREDTAFKRASRSIGDYSRKLAKATKNHFDLKKAAAATGSAINTKLAAIGGGAAVGLSAGELVNDEAFWTRLKTDSSAAEETIEDLKKRTFDMSVQMRIDPDQLKAAIAEIQQQTGDLDLARENLENMAIAIQGSGAAGIDIGGLIANMNKKQGLRNANEMLENLDIAKQLGDKGAFTLRDYSSMGGRVLSDLGARGITGTQGNIEAMSLLQFGMQGTNSKEMAVSASETVTRDIVSNRDVLAELGIDVFDPDKEGEQMRLPSEIIKEIFTATDGRTTQLTEIFGDESFRLIKAMQQDYKNDWKEYNSYLETQGDGTKLTSAAEENKSTASSGLTYLSALWKSFLDDAGSSLITSTADLFDDTDNDTAKKVVGSTGLGAMGAAGGASVGAAIGSIVPVLGTAVGAGVGAIVGGLGGAISGYVLSGDSEDDNRTITNSSSRFATTENQQSDQHNSSASQTINTPTSAAPVTVSHGDTVMQLKEGGRDDNRTITNSSTRFATTENQQSDQHNSSASQTINTPTSAAPVTVPLGDTVVQQNEGGRDDNRTITNSSTRFATTENQQSDQHNSSASQTINSPTSAAPVTVPLGDTVVQQNEGGRDDNRTITNSSTRFATTESQQSDQHNSSASQTINTPTSAAPVTVPLGDTVVQQNEGGRDDNRTITNSSTRFATTESQQSDQHNSSASQTINSPTSAAPVTVSLGDTVMQQKEGERDDNRTITNSSTRFATTENQQSDQHNSSANQTINSPTSAAPVTVPLGDTVMQLKEGGRDDNRTITNSSTRFATTENQQSDQRNRSVSQTINTSTSADQQAQTLIQQFQRQEALIKEKAAASAAPVTVSMGDIVMQQKEGERDDDFLERARAMIREEMELAAEKLRREQERALTDNTGASYG